MQPISVHQLLRWPNVCIEAFRLCGKKMTSSVSQQISDLVEPALVYWLWLNYHIILNVFVFIWVWNHNLRKERNSYWIRTHRTTARSVLEKDSQTMVRCQDRWTDCAFMVQRTGRHGRNRRGRSKNQTDDVCIYTNTQLCWLQRWLTTFDWIKNKLFNLIVLFCFVFSELEDKLSLFVVTLVLASFSLLQKEKIREKFVAALKEQFAGRGLRFTKGERVVSWKAMERKCCHSYFETKIGLKIKTLQDTKS